MPKLPEQCMAVIKPLGVTRAHRCPVPAMPEEFYCPIHMVLSRRIIERAKRHRRLLKYYREEVK